MKKQIEERWTLNRDEVDYTMSSGGFGRRRVRESRAASLTSAQIELIHRPTGLKVRGSVPRGHQSREAMRDLKAALWSRLFSELEVKVARALKIPRR
jgi:hypothetical protein